MQIDTVLARCRGAGGSERATRETQCRGLMDKLIALFIVGLGLSYRRQIIQDMRPTRQLKQAIRAG